MELADHRDFLEVEGKPDPVHPRVGDRDFATDAFRERIWDLGARPAIPPKRTDAPVACPAWIYSNHHPIEAGMWVKGACRRSTGPG